MSLGILTSTLQALHSVETTLSNVTPLHESKVAQSLSELWRKRLQLILISATVGGIEFCYAAETALVSPLLLQLGVPDYLMPLSWMVSPILGFFLVPLLGTCSDTCRSKLGRRRPFVLLYSVGIILGLLLVPYGKDLGVLLGDTGGTTEFIVDMSNSSNITTTSLSNISTAFAVSKYHTKGIIITIAGVILLDFCCDACQTPCRTLLIDTTVESEHITGLTTFTVVAGIGGGIGYLLGGIHWRKPDLLTTSDPNFFIHVDLVFGFVLFAFLICLSLTMCSIREKSLSEVENPSQVYLKLYNQEQANTSSNYQEQSPSDSDSETDNIHQSVTRKASMLSRISEMSEEDFKEQTERVQAEDSSEDDHKESTSDSTVNLACSQSMNDLTMHTDMRMFLKSIICMPRHMWLLCLTNLFCWMALVSYSLYFTDFMGKAVYQGDPNGPIGSILRQKYNFGVHMGSFAMIVYSLSCMLYSMVIDKLIAAVGTRAVYVGGQLLYSIGMLALGLSKSVYVAFVSSITTGILYATLFTLPYILVAKYHCDPEFSKLHTASKGVQRCKVRGLGTDVAIVSSMVFAGQFLLSLIIGTVIHAVDSTVVVPISASVLSFCGSISALKIEYVN